MRNVVTRGGKSIEIAGMIVMQMGQDDVGDFIRVDVDQPQRVHWTAQMLALAADGRFFGESGVHHEHAIAAAHYPDEIVQVGPVLVRIGQYVALPRMAISQMAVTNRKNFEWFHSSRIDHYNGNNRRAPKYTPRQVRARHWIYTRSRPGHGQTIRRRRLQYRHQWLWRRAGDPLHARRDREGTRR